MSVFKNKNVSEMIENDKRRTILLIITIICGILAFLSVLKIPQKGYAKIRSLMKKEVVVYEEKIDIDGLDEPFTIFFVADSHICLCDDRDKESKEICDKRYQEFIRDSKGSEKNFSIVMDYVRKEDPDLVVFGGDITDEATCASIDYFKKEADKLSCPYYLLMGNHDLLINGEFASADEYEEIRKRYDFVRSDRSAYNIERFDHFNLLLLDDCNNQICNEVGEAIADLEKDGKPVIIAQHVPFVPTYGDSDLLLRTNDVWGSAYLDYSRVLMGEHANLPNEATSKLIDFVSKEDGLTDLIMAGHIHFYHRDFMSPKTVQTVTPPAFERGVIKITLY